MLMMLMMLMCGRNEVLSLTWLFFSLQRGGSVRGGNHGDLRHAAGCHLSFSWAEASEGGVRLSESHDPAKLQWVSQTNTEESVYSEQKNLQSVCFYSYVIQISLSLCFIFTEQNLEQRGRWHLSHIWPENHKSDRGNTGLVLGTCNNQSSD